MLGYILDPTLQVQDVHGGTIAGAKIYLYDSNTSELATSYKDFNGAMNTNPIITDTLGNCTVIGVKGQSYDAVFKDANDNLLFSKQNLTIGNGAVGGGNTIVSAGYGIVVTPSVSGNIDNFEVAIDPTVVATISGANAIEAGDNILIKTTASGTKQINVTSAIHLGNAVYQSDYKRNGIETQNILTEDYTQVKPDGVRVANDSDDNYFIINQHTIEGGDGNDLVQLDATSLDIDHNDGTYERQIHLGTAGGPDTDWFQGLLIKNSVNSGSLSANTYDVKLQNNTGTYSLVATNQLANSAMSAAQNPGYFLSAGANINITGNTVSAKNWTNEIAQATSGKLDTSATTNWDVAAYSAGNNINITNHVISGKDWTSAINNAASTNGWDVAAYSAGANINITNHVVSAKNWSNDILAATSGKIDKVVGGAGSEVNPVYLDASNVVRPCFSGDSVKFASSAVPGYFAGDLAGNTFVYNVSNNSSTSAYSIRNSVIIGNSDNYRRSTSSHEHFDKCIFMGDAYMYGVAGSPTLTNNIIIGSNSISQVASNSDSNTVIGTDNDIICSDQGKCNSNTLVGYQNNIWGVGQQCAMYGSNNDINLEHLSFSGSTVSIFGYNNRWQPKSNSVYDGVIVGNYNNVAASGNYRTMAVGFSNAISGNCTTLIGNDLTANNEGSYEDQVMKVGFGKCHLEIHSSGTIYKVVNGTKTAL